MTCRRHRTRDGWKSLGISTFAAASSPSSEREWGRRMRDTRKNSVGAKGQNRNIGGALLRASSFVLASLVGITSACSSSNLSTTPARGAIAPGLDVITQADIRRDLFALGGDAMRGREAGTLDEMRATGWVAERAREAGLLPAGDDNTFFQWWPMRRSRLSENSQISINGRGLRLWKDAVVLNAAQGSLDLP